MVSVPIYKDEYGNPFYILKDKLYVDLVKLKLKRLIGSLTYNLTTNKANLTIYRKSTEKYKMGYFISSAVFEILDIDRVILIEDNTKVYNLNWKLVKQHRKAWTFTPSNGMENQYLIPDHFWTHIMDV